jgi:hypothetical protein
MHRYFVARAQELLSSTLRRSWPLDADTEIGRILSDIEDADPPATARPETPKSDKDLAPERKV